MASILEGKNSSTTYELTSFVKIPSLNKKMEKTEIGYHIKPGTALDHAALHLEWRSVTKGQGQNSVCKKEIMPMMVSQSCEFQVGFGF